jgi:hypothetical protein
MKFNNLSQAANDRPAEEPDIQCRFSMKTT